MIATVKLDGLQLATQAEDGSIEHSTEDTSRVSLVCHEVPVRCSRCSEELVQEDAHDAHGACMGWTWVSAGGAACRDGKDAHEPAAAPLGWLDEATIAVNEGEDSAEVILRTNVGAFTLHMYRSPQDGHLYLVAPSVHGAPDRTLLEHVGGTTYRHPGDLLA